jgi:mRNA interferase RelE/StbE
VSRGARQEFLSMYRIVLTPHAAKDIKRLPKSVLARIDRAILKLENNPHRQSNIKYLRDIRLADFRFRIGDYRVLFDIDEPNQTVVILSIGHRKDIYR